jgi:hypothetical protein
VVERQDRSVADLGLTLAEGRALLAKVQSILVSQQTAGWMASQVACCRCGSVLAHKDSRSIVMRTVFGKVEVPSPRLWACSCRHGIRAQLGCSIISSSRSRARLARSNGGFENT